MKSNEVKNDEVKNIPTGASVMVCWVKLAHMTSASLMCTGLSTSGPLLLVQLYASVPGKRGGDPST